MKKKLFSVLLTGVLALTSFAQNVSLPTTSPDFTAILKKLDESSNFSGQDFSALFTMVAEKPGKKQEVTQTRMFRRDDKEQFLMLLQLPEANKGQGYLKEGDNVWFYDPTSRKFSHSSMKEKINGSQANNNDFKRRNLTEDYTVQKGEAGMLGKIPVWIITLKAKTNEASYDVIRLHVRQDQPVLLKQEDMSVSGRLMRTTLYPKYSDLGGGKMFPRQMLIVDEINVGEKTQITLAETSLGKIPDKVFTKAFLEAVN